MMDKKVEETEESTAKDTIRNRVGRFKISQSTIIDSYEVARAVLSKVVVVRAESMFISNSVAYTAFSEEFDAVPEGHLPPYYCVVLSRLEENEQIDENEEVDLDKLVIKFVRQDF